MEKSKELNKLIKNIKIDSEYYFGTLEYNNNKDQIKNKEQVNKQQDNEIRQCFKEEIKIRKNSSNQTEKVLESNQCQLKDIYETFSRICNNQNIQKIDLKYSNFQDKQQIPYLYKLFSHENLSKSVKTLTLKNCKIEIQGMKSLTQSLKLLPQLKTININYCQLRNQQLQVFAKSTGELPHLEELNFSYNQISDWGLQKFSQQAYQYKNLKIINFNYNLIRDDGFKAFSINHMHFPSLISMHFQFNIIFDQGMRIFSQNIFRFNKLRQVDISHNKIQKAGFQHLTEQNKQISNIKILNLSYNQLRYQNCKSLLKNLYRFPRLQKLNMNINKIHDEGFKYFCGQTKTFHTLKFIGFRDNQITDDLFEGFIENSHKFPNLQKMDFSKNWLATASIALWANNCHKFKYIKSVDFSINGFRRLKQSEIDLMYGGQKPKSFILNLNCNPLINDSYEIIIKLFIEKQIQIRVNPSQLQLSRSGIKLGDLIKFGSTKSKNLKDLKVLKMVDNKVTNEEIQSFFENIDEFKKLLELVLDYNNISQLELNTIQNLDKIVRKQKRVVSSLDCEEQLAPERRFVHPDDYLIISLKNNPLSPVTVQSIQSFYLQYPSSRLCLITSNQLCQVHHNKRIGLNRLKLYHNQFNVIRTIIEQKRLAIDFWKYFYQVLQMVRTQMFKKQLTYTKAKQIWQDVIVNRGIKKLPYKRQFDQTIKYCKEFFEQVMIRWNQIMIEDQQAALNAQEQDQYEYKPRYESYQHFEDFFQNINSKKYDAQWKYWYRLLQNYDNATACEYYFLTW